MFRGCQHTRASSGCNRVPDARRRRPPPSCVHTSQHALGPGAYTLPEPPAPPPPCSAHADGRPRCVSHCRCYSQRPDASPAMLRPAEAPAAGCGIARASALQCQLCGAQCGGQHPCGACGALFYCSDKHRRRHLVQPGGHREECRRMAGQAARAQVWPGRAGGREVDG